MSTIPNIIEHEKDGANLNRFTPRFRGNEQEVRILTVATTVYQWLEEESALEEMVNVRSQCRAHFGHFVRGQPVDDLDFMKRVEDRRSSRPSFSHGVWSITPRFKPQHRFFGLFATFNWFVLLNMQSRDALNSFADWHAEIRKSLTLWADLFPGCDPWVPEELEMYMSNAEKCDDRW